MTISELIAALEDARRRVGPLAPVRINTDEYIGMEIERVAVPVNSGPFGRVVLVAS